MARIRFAAILLLLSAAAAFAREGEDPLSRWITVDGLSIHYLEAGAPSDPVLLMVHGWCGSAEDYRSVLQMLPAGVRGISVDLPGCGLSDKPRAVYDVPYFVAFLRSFCAVAGLDRFVLVAHSMGGQIAIHFTSLWPESVAKLVLIAPNGLTGEEGAWLLLARMGPLVDVCFQLNNRLFIRWATEANLFYHPTPQLVDAMVESTSRSILGCESARAIASITRNVIGTDPVDDLLATIGQETLILWGDHDKVLSSRWAGGFLSRLPHVRLEMIADSGHMLMLEKPRETTDLILGFIGGTP